MSWAIPSHGGESALVSSSLRKAPIPSWALYAHDLIQASLPSKGPTLKYHHLEDKGFNIWIWGDRNVHSLAITSESLLSYIIYEGSLLPTKSNSNHLSSFRYHNWMPSKVPDVFDEPSPPFRSVSSLPSLQAVLIHYLHFFLCSFSSLGVH